MGERIKERMARLMLEYELEQDKARPKSESGCAESEPKLRQPEIAGQENPGAAAADERRRARTHRLVQIGAITDQYLGTRDMTPEQVMMLITEITRQPEVKEIVAKLVAEIGKQPAEKTR